MDHALPHPVPPKIETTAEAARTHLATAMTAAGYLNPGVDAIAAGEVHALVSIAASLRQLVYLQEISYSQNAAVLAVNEEALEVAKEGWAQNREQAELAATRFNETLARLRDQATKLDLIEQALNSQPQPIPAELAEARCCDQPIPEAGDQS